MIVINTFKPTVIQEQIRIRDLEDALSLAISTLEGYMGNDDSEIATLGYLTGILENVSDKE